MLKMMIVGATSAIAHETARNFAADGAAFFLVARSADKLRGVADDLSVRGAKQVETHLMDVNEFDQHQAIFENAISALNGLDAIFIAHGTLGDQETSQADYATTLQEINTNFLSAASFLTLAANYFEAHKRGAIAVISSVAGDRGRASNYVYGTSMAAKTAFVSGLRNRLASAGVSVLTIKPGFVDTPMTADVPKNALFASPESVGKSIYKAMKDGRDVIYVPFFWRYIMMIIRLLPEPIFKRLSL